MLEQITLDLQNQMLLADPYWVCRIPSFPAVAVALCEAACVQTLLNLSSFLCVEAFQSNYNTQERCNTHFLLVYLTFWEPCVFHVVVLAVVKSC